MSEETAAPTAEPAPASAETIALNAAIDAAPGENTEAEAPAEGEKKTKTPEERRLAQLQRAVDRRTKRIGALEQELAEFRANGGLRQRQVSADNDASADDDGPVSLTRAELDELVTARAKKLAPTLTEQAAEAKRRAGVVDSLAKTWGKEKFDELASDLNEAFDGLVDGSGRPKPATDAVFEADDPKAVIEFLADPENLEEAERIARLNPVQAGKAIAKLEAQMKANAAKDKPRASNAPAPLEPVKGAGPAKLSLLDLEGEAFDKRRREQIANRR